MKTTPVSADYDQRLPSDIAAFDRLSNPIWVFDPAIERKLYANRSAVALWGAKDSAELRAKDFSVKSEAARTRTAQTLATVRTGESKRDIWTFYPNGEPVSVRTVASLIRLRDGSGAILFEATIADEPAEYLRALTAVRNAPNVVSIYDATGLETFGNPRAAQTYADRPTFRARCENAGEGSAAWATVIEHGDFRGRLSMLTTAGVTCHEVMLQRTLDPITGDMAVLSYERDDTDRVETETRLAVQAEALADARDKADAANQAKSAFLANMSHEIRTPLNGVVSLADLLCRSDLTGSQREAAELIRTSGRSLEQLLADILQLAQIEAGEVAVTIAPFDPVKVAIDVTDLLRLKAEECSTTLTLRVDTPGPHWRDGDALRFRQVVTNLVSNAVKFTRRGSVLVVLEDRDDGLRILVEDTGVGFGEAEKARIFERFQQADATITRRFGGSGLGLAITSELVALMSGRIGCSSIPGKGSSFWVDLPFPIRPVVAASPRNAHDDGDLQGLHVLVADDHPVNRRVAEMVLQPLGADVVSVENGAEAVEAVRRNDFDVVLMDMQMPVMDGLEATRLISAAEGPPVIMVSANGMPEHVQAALDAGAVAHVTKPIEPAVLVETISATVVNAKASPPTVDRAA